MTMKNKIVELDVFGLPSVFFNIADIVAIERVEQSQEDIKLEIELSIIHMPSIKFEVSDEEADRILAQWKALAEENNNP